MHLSEFCIRRPVMTTLLSLAVVILGLFAYQSLPIAALPSFDTPTLNVSANLGGASPQTMAISVARPLEKEFSTIAGLKLITSSSRLGSTSITLEFEEGRDIDKAALDVQAALLRAQRSMPQEMDNLPSYRKVNPADAPILLLSMTSPAMPVSELNAYAENLISPNLATIAGVAQVNVFGQRKYAVRISVDPDRLAARDLSLAEVGAALRKLNANGPVGTLEGSRQALIIEANPQLQNANAFAEQIIALKNGQPVRLKDIAQVQDSIASINSAAFINGERGLVMGIQRQPGANTVAVVEQIRAKLPQLSAQMPASIGLEIRSDRSLSIRESIHDVNFTLGLTVVLVILVIFLFLRRLSATLIPTLTLPISLISTFALMAYFGQSLNNISLLGITLAVGLVVDDAIVVLENIVRHIEQGMSPLAAAIKGAREVSFTILSISLSLVAVFIPIFFMPGVIGKLFHEFAVVVSLAILVSAIASLTLIPLLCARWLKHENPHAPQSWLIRQFETLFESLLAQYSRVLDWSLAHQKSILGLAVFTFALSGWLFYSIPKGFFPEEDIGSLTVGTEASLDIAYPSMLALQRQVEARIRANPHVQHVVTVAGGGNTGRLFVTLKPRSQRPAMRAVIQQLRKASSDLVGIRVFYNPDQNLRLGGRPSSSKYQYTLQAVQSEQLYQWADILKHAMQQEPMLRDVNSDAQRDGLQASLRIDREHAARLGIDMGNLRDTLFAAFGDKQVASIYTPEDDYKVIMRFADSYRSDETAFERIKLRASNGQLVPLTAFATVERSVGPTVINHQGQLQAVTLSFNLSEGVAIGNALARIEAIKKEVKLPASMLTSLGGDAASFQDSQSSQWLLILLALGVIYVLLGVLYESFIHPLTILAGLPSAAVGALLTLRLFNLELTLIALIGILMLIGIVKKNAIMMIDFAIARRAQDQCSAHDAIRQACLTRFRPIMMTTMAALMGALPLALALGAGAELRQPLGLAVVGGLVYSQVVTLVVTPVIYLFLDCHCRRAEGI